jgi:hypothetical protein
MPSASRRLLLAAGIAVTLAAAGLVADKLFRGGLPAPFDFAAFWVAGHLAVEGHNPYDPHLVRQVQRDLGMNDKAIPIWNPPWALTLVMPIGAMPFQTALGVWVLVHLALVVVSAELLWRGFGGPPDRRWVAYLLTLTFVPVAFLIGGGQITAVVLFGLAAFLVAARANRPLLAGMLGAITAVKPHLLVLFALWLLLESLRTCFGRRVLLGGLIVGALACLPPTLANPGVWDHYLGAVNAPSSDDHYHLSRWTPPLVGWWLRTAVPGQPFWVQWLPLVVCVMGFLTWYARRTPRSSPLRFGEGSVSGAPNPPTPFPRREGGEVSGSPPHFGEGLVEHLPWLVGLSLLVAPYGVWQHDLVLLLVPILAVAAKLAAQPHRVATAVGVTSLVGVNAVTLAMMLNHVSSEWYVWVTPIVLLGCRLTLAAARQPAPVLSPIPAGA